MVGLVLPGSEVELIEGRWETHPHRKAILKTVKMIRVREVSLDIPELNYGKPRQGTLMRWHRSGDLVERLVEGRRSRQSVSALTPTATEVMCAEYLRKIPEVSSPIKICSLLAPVGRTMAGVDVWGVNVCGDQVLAQVTQSSDPGVINAKCQALSTIANNSSRKKSKLVMIAPASAQLPDSNIVHLHLEVVFKEFLQTKEGRQWWTLIRR